LEFPLERTPLNAFPDPVWPVLALAAIQVVDGLLCLKPVSFIAQCFDDVHWPRRLWWVMPPLKFTAAVGLLAGLWVPYLAALTCGALVVYFVVAIGMHVAARDFGRNLFVNATGMLAICIATGIACFLA
jgi:hypothetical protein